MYTLVAFFAVDWFLSIIKQMSYKTSKTIQDGKPHNSISTLYNIILYLCIVVVTQRQDSMRPACLCVTTTLVDVRATVYLCSMLPSYMLVA